MVNVLYLLQVEIYLLPIYIYLWSAVPEKGRHLHYYAFITHHRFV